MRSLRLLGGPYCSSTIWPLAYSKRFRRDRKARLGLRPPAGAAVATATVVRGAEVAEAELILSAICAMKVPRPIMIAAKIIMLRITPFPSRKARFDHATRPSASGAAAGPVPF